VAASRVVRNSRFFTSRGGKYHPDVWREKETPPRQQKVLGFGVFRGKGTKDGTKREVPEEGGIEANRKEKEIFFFRWRGEGCAAKEDRGKRGYLWS